MAADLVVFGEDWGAHPSSTQHLIKRLNAQRRVIWVNSIGLRRPRISLHDAKRMWRKLRGMMAQGGAVSPQENISVISPRAIPMPASRLEHQINRRLIANSVGARMRQLSISRPILWTSLPSAVDVVGALGEKAVVYYCGDDFGALDGVDHARVLDMEAELVARADLILVASDKLRQKFPAAKTHCIPHGADVAAFQVSAAAPLDLPVGKPIAGFYGSLSAWVDIPLVRHLALRLPNWNFVFIGAEKTDLTPIRNLSNVFLLGPKTHEQLPAYVQNWHVSLLPFVDNAQIRACNPLKLREYLAAGKPIVSIDFPALNGYRDLVYVANQVDDFAAAIETAGRENSANGGLRRARVQTESWENRAADVAQLLERL